MARFKWLGTNGQSFCMLIIRTTLRTHGMGFCIVVSLFLWAPEIPSQTTVVLTLLGQAFKHIFTSPSSVDQAPKAMRSGNAQIHGMWSVTKASIAYTATQVSSSGCVISYAAQHCVRLVFPLLWHKFSLAPTLWQTWNTSITVSWSYSTIRMNRTRWINYWSGGIGKTSILFFFRRVLRSMNSQVFPLYSNIKWLPSKNSALARIRQKHAEYQERQATQASDTA